MVRKMGTWPRIFICAAAAGGIALVGVAGQYVFADAGGFPDLLTLICRVLAVLLALVAVIGALNRLVARTDR
jgi:hypothetical protein